MRAFLLSLLLVLFLAGCISAGPGSVVKAGGGVEIEEFTAVPFKIYEGQKAVLKLKLKNMGDFDVDAGSIEIYGYGSDFRVRQPGSGGGSASQEAGLSKASFSLSGAEGLLGISGDETLKTWIVEYITDLPPGQVFSYNFFARVCYSYESMAYGKVEVMQEDEYLLKLAENKLSPREITLKNTNAPIKISVRGTQPVISNQGTIKFKLLIQNLGPGFLGGCPTSEGVEDDSNSNTIELTIKLGGKECIYSKDIYLRKGQSREITVVCNNLAAEMPSGTYDLVIEARYNYSVEAKTTLMVEGTPGKPAGKAELAGSTGGERPPQPPSSGGGTSTGTTPQIEQNEYVSVLVKDAQDDTVTITFSDWINMLKAIEDACGDKFKAVSDIDLNSRCIKDVPAENHKDVDLEVTLGGLALDSSGQVKKTVQFMERPKINGVYFKSVECQDKSDEEVLKDCEKSHGSDVGYLFGPVSSNSIWLRTYYMGRSDETRSHTNIKPDTELSNLNTQHQISLKLLLKSFVPGRETKFPLMLKFKIIDTEFVDKKDEINGIIYGIIDCLNVKGGALKYEYKNGCKYNAKDLALESEKCKSSCDCIETDLCNYIISKEQGTEVTDENCKKCIGSYLAKDKFAEEVINIMYSDGVSSSKKSQIKKDIASLNPFLSCSNPASGEIKPDCVLRDLKEVFGTVQESSREKYITIKEKSYNTYDFSIRGLSEKQLSCVKKYTEGDTACESEKSIDECLKLNCFRRDDTYFQNRLNNIKDGMSEEEIKRVLTNQTVEIMKNEVDYTSTCEIYMRGLNYDKNTGTCRPELKIICKGGLFDLTSSNENKNYIGYTTDNKPYISNSDSVTVTPSGKIRFGYAKLSQDFSKFCKDKAVYLEIEPTDGGCSADAHWNCEKCYAREYKFRISLSGLDCSLDPPQQA